MTSLSKAAARVIFPLAFGAFVFTSTASADPEIEDIKDYCGEIHQIVTESRGWLVTEAENLYVKKTLCQKLALKLTDEALKDTAGKAAIYRTAKELGKALKELASTIGLPGGVKLEEALEKGLEKLNDAAKKKAKEELQKALKKLAGEHDPAGYRYTKEGKVLGCDYTMVVTWNINNQTFMIRTTGDCHCKVVESNQGSAKMGKWQSTIKGIAKINAKFGAGELVTGLDVTAESYSGAGSCNCDKGNISLPQEYTETISVPEIPTETVALISTVREHERVHERERDRDRDVHKREREHERTVERERERDRELRKRERKQERTAERERKRERTAERKRERKHERTAERQGKGSKHGFRNAGRGHGHGMKGRGMQRMAFAGGGGRRR